jgi:hypothetical protein
MRNAGALRIAGAHLGQQAAREPPTRSGAHTRREPSAAALRGPVAPASRTNRIKSRLVRLAAPGDALAWLEQFGCSWPATLAMRALHPANRAGKRAAAHLAHARRTPHADAEPACGVRSRCRVAKNSAFSWLRAAVHRFAPRAVNKTAQTCTLPAARGRHRGAPPGRSLSCYGRRPSVVSRARRGPSPSDRSGSSEQPARGSAWPTARLGSSDAACAPADAAESERKTAPRSAAARTSRCSERAATERGRVRPQAAACSDATAMRSGAHARLSGARSRSPRPSRRC